MFCTPVSHDCCAFVTVRGCGQVPRSPQTQPKIHFSLLQPSTAQPQFPHPFSPQSNMKQTREQAILLFSGIFNCDEKGLCRFL